jgi:hypothetical protein
LRVDRAQSAQGLAYRGRVVGKVVDDCDAVYNGADFKTTLDALEAGQRGLNGFPSDAETCCQRGSGSGVECVVLTGQTHLQL